MGNARPLCVPAAAGTDVALDYLILVAPISQGQGYQPYSFTTIAVNHPRDVTGSGSSAHCPIFHTAALQRRSRPYLSSSVIGLPPRPTIDHQLGRPLPHQQLNLV